VNTTASAADVGTQGHGEPTEISSYWASNGGIDEE
jgi:hypothetical protein